MNLQIIATNLIKLRQEHKLTQEDLANRLHISRQAISKWETGASIPNLETLLILSKLYRISINEILEPTTPIQITCFEDIINLDSSIIENVLSQINTIELVKASMGASPNINELFRKLFKDIDFDFVRIHIGSVKITEIDNIHNLIVEMFNSQLSNIN